MKNRNGMKNRSEKTIRVIPRKCPKCNKQLHETEFFGIKLDECSACFGLWFDAGELNRLKTEMDGSLRWIDVDLWKYAERANFNASEVDCPHCQSLMSVLQFGDSSIALEFCINCGGAWLDLGEHQAVVQHVRDQAAALPLAELKATTLRQFKEIFSGPKGMIDEVKDFVAAWRLMSLRFAVEHPSLVEKYRQFRGSLPF